MCCDIIAMHWQKHIFQIYDKGGYGEVVEAGAGGGALLTPRPLQHTSSVSKVKPGLLDIILDTFPPLKLASLSSRHDVKTTFRLLVELNLLEEFPALSNRVECLPYIPCHEGAAVECQFAKT